MCNSFCGWPETDRNKFHLYRVIICIDIICINFVPTQMSKDFAEMQEDEPGLIIDTDLITGAIESAGVGQETTNGVPFSVSGNNASLSFCNFSI